MKNGFTVFFASFVVLGFSWTGFVLGSVLQLGHQKQGTILNSSDTYPTQRPGYATMGLQVYRASGCAACHTQQIQQDGVACDVVLTSAGKTPMVVSNLIAKLDLHGLDTDQAGDVASQITAAGGSSETHVYATGGDITRGWGLRESVAADYLYDYPVQLGYLRIGPDLAGIGARMPDAKWQLAHLYAPTSRMPGSAMPAFKYLFEVRPVGISPSPDALDLPQGYAPPEGYEVVPKPAAKYLVAYLLSLRADVPLYEAPFSPPAAKSH